MCGKYRVSTEEENIELREIIDSIQRKYPDAPIRTGDILPSQAAPALTAEGAGLMAWGFPRPQAKALIINARSETAVHMPMFRDALAQRRCLLPATLFYEWDAEKNIRRFMPPAGSLLYMAGIYMQADPLPRFVILTRPADARVSPYHNRMPFLLQSPEYRHTWLHNPGIGPGMLRMLPEDILSVA